MVPDVVSGSGQCQPWWIDENVLGLGFGLGLGLGLGLRLGSDYITTSDYTTGLVIAITP